ncbi:MAG: hypothetical protein HYX51_02745 [Chloroflexi bacterium]|nr:hypothetical protein [Chloroflexota bacterium]
MTNQPAVPNPTEIWARAFQTWTEAWSSFAGAATGTAAPAAGDPLQIWRKSMDQWMEGWTAFFEQTLTTPETAAAGGRALDAMLNVEKPLRERTAAQMQYWLEIMNMPSRRDLVRVLTQLNETNTRLDELQVQIEELGDRIAEVGERASLGNLTPNP